MTSWKSVSLADVAVVSSGDGAPQETSAFGQSGIPFVRAGSLGSLLNGLSEDQLERIPEHESAKRRMRIFPPGTVLFAKSGMSCTKGLVYQSQGRIHVVNHLAAIECGPELFSRFLVRWLERHSPARLIANYSYPSIKVSDIRAERVPLPPLADQKRIAGILDAADALRAKRRESLAQLDSLLQSTFLDMFGDPVTNPMGWESPTLASFCKTGTGGTPSRKKMGRYFEKGTIPWVKSGELKEELITDTSEHITEAALKETNVKLVPKGGLLLALYGATVGRLGILDVEATTNQAVCHIIPEPLRAETLYLFHCLANQVKYLVGRGVGGAQPNISQGIVKALRIPLPDLPLQRRFSAIVESVGRQKDGMRAHLAELDALFASLQSRAFIGQL